MTDLVIIEADTLREECREMGFELVYGPRDQQAALPHIEFLQELFNSLPPRKFRKEARDCDNFAMRFVVEVSESIARRNELVGHSVCYCCIRIAEGRELNGVRDGFHATCLAKLADGQWIFFEPQNGKDCDARKAISDGVVSGLDFVLV